MVQNDLSVKVLASTDFGPESSIGKSGFQDDWKRERLIDEVPLDFDAVDAVVDATHRYHEIFYEKQQ